MTYQPNFNDPRIQRKIKKALGFLSSIFKDDKTEKWLTQAVIEKYIGRSDKDFGKYLRDKLLIETHQHSIKEGKAKTYVLNQNGFEFLYEKSIHLLLVTAKNGEKRDTNELAIEWANETFRTELETKQFILEEKSHRLCSELQHIRSDVRHKLFAINGMPYSYDIKSASATILYQLHKKVPTKTGPKGGHISGYDGKQRIIIKTYVKHKDAIRKQLAYDTGITIEQSKKVFAAIFNRAKFTPHDKCDIYRTTLKKDTKALYRIIKHPFIKALRKEVNEMWNIINDLFLDRYTTIDKKTSKRRIKPSESFNLYFAEERKIIDAVMNLCSTRNISFFPEHDGWTISSHLSPDELEEHIRLVTGYDVSLDYVYYGDM